MNDVQASGDADEEDETTRVSSSTADNADSNVQRQTQQTTPIAVGVGRREQFMSPSYISPVSSATTPTAHASIAESNQEQHQVQQHQQQQFSTTPQAPSEPIRSTEVRNTIDSNVRKNSNASSEVMNIPPVHPFLGQHSYDSDGSDGSFVIQYNPAGTAASSSSKRERFPSFDSMASTGSLRYVPANANAYGPPLHHQQTQQPAQLNPHLLPYHERRKILQKRQEQKQQQQQNQQQQQRRQQFPAEFLPGHEGLSQQQKLHLQQQQFHQHQMMIPPEVLAAYHQQGFAPPYGSVPGMSFPPFHPQPGFRIPHPHMQFMPMGAFPPPPPNPSFQQQHQQMQQQHQHDQMKQQQKREPQQSPARQQHLPEHVLPPPEQFRSPVRLSPYRSIGKMDTLNSRPPSGIKNGQKRRQQQQQQQQQQQTTQPNSGQTGSLPPSGPNRSRARAPSQEYISSESPPSSSSRRKRHPMSRQGHRSDASPPPPPPPLPPHSQYHIRADSSGSVSSLGSIGLGSRDYEEEDIQDAAGNNNSNDSQHRRAHSRTGSGGSGFFDMIRQQWSPKQETTAPTVSDFHRKNQEFLHRSNQPERSVSRSSPAHRRVGSMDRPPASRGTHKRLPSINNDDWQEIGGNIEDPRIGAAEDDRSTGNRGGAVSSSSDHTDDEYESDEPNERTSLLPPSGISTNERDGKESYPGDSYRRNRRAKGSANSSSSARHRQLVPPDEQSTRRMDNRLSSDMLEQATKLRKGRKGKKKRRKHRRKGYHARSGSSEDSNVDSMTTDSSYDYREWTRKRAKMLEKQRSQLIEQWKAEARQEANEARKVAEANLWYTRLGRYLDSEFASIQRFLANIPLTIGAVAMAVVTLGIVWFKFAEENLDSCEPVHFHSSQCTFPEFPGCFYCDSSARMYQIAVYFHFGCKGLAGLLAMTFVAKVLLATRVVIDEMSSPTTSSPAGLLCMTTVCVFAGRGLIGQMMVSLAAVFHLGLVIWFIYMALAYHIMPEPSWFPNTIGVGLSAVKIWLYYPMPGHLLMAISLCLNFLLFPISLIRVAVNEKISATVGWMQMGAPAISLYALTIMAQPSFLEEHPDVTRFQKVHRMVYLPCMHFMAALSVIGFFASVHSLWMRWTEFRKKEFSPAHAAFCFPVLSHANAIQAYRGAIYSFSDIHPRTWRMLILYTYWVIVLVGGTIATIYITAKYLYCLPRWTNLDLEGEEEPPPPDETILHRHNMVTAGETLRQPFVSPAVLQSNETGILVLTRDAEDGRQTYKRTRRLPALGFEPTMNWSEMEREREVLLKWVGENSPRRRRRTLSVPGIDFNYGVSLGTGNLGVYAVPSPTYSDTQARQRAETASPNQFF